MSKWFKIRKFYDRYMYSYKYSLMVFVYKVSIVSTGVVIAMSIDRLIQLWLL